MRCSLSDEANPERGFIFDGRLAEDFKLSSGTWVSVGPLRGKFLQRAAPYAKDVVVAGHDREYVRSSSFPTARLLTTSTHKYCRRWRKNEGQLEPDCARILIGQLFALDAGEITDKGSINQRSVLTNRASLVEDLYAKPAPPHVIVCSAGSRISSSRSLITRCRGPSGNTSACRQAIPAGVPSGLMASSNLSRAGGRSRNPGLHRFRGASRSIGVRRALSPTSGSLRPRALYDASDFGATR